jgi:hypothetical protein
LDWRGSDRPHYRRWGGRGLGLRLRDRLCRKSFFRQSIAFAFFYESENFEITHDS